MHPSLKTIWEVITFKEFLGEISTNDEVLFYLHCRNLLFDGPSYNYLDKKYTVYTYVRYQKAEKLVELILKKYDPLNI